MASFTYEVAVKAHADLMHAIQEHDGKVTGKSFDPGLYETRSAGQVFADAEFYTQIIKLTAEFGKLAAIVPFLIYVRPILLKWFELKKDRSIEIRHGDKSIHIKGENDIDKALKALRKLKSKKASRDKS